MEEGNHLTPPPHQNVHFRIAQNVAGQPTSFLALHSLVQITFHYGRRRSAQGPVESEPL